MLYFYYFIIGYYFICSNFIYSNNSVVTEEFSLLLHIYLSLNKKKYI